MSKSPQVPKARTPRSTGMSQAGAEKAITVSALAVAGIYAYRRLTEGSGPPSSGSRAKQLAGQGTPAPLGVFITAWGFTFLGVSVMAAISPGLGGSFAILIAVADALGNLDQVSKDVNTKLKAGAATPAGADSFGSSVGSSISATGDTIGSAVSGVGAQVANPLAIPPSVFTPGFLQGGLTPGFLGFQPIPNAHPGQTQATPIPNAHPGTPLTTQNLVGGAH